MADWTIAEWVIVAGSPIVALLGMVLTLVTLPGTWLIVLWSAGIAVWQPQVAPWWLVVAMVVLAGVGEALEFVASALGAAKAGASKWGVILSIAGALVGAIVGMFIIPVIGAIIFGAVGAAAGAIAGEMAIARRTWEDSRKIAAGAAIGRLLATVAKGLVALLMGAVLCGVVLLRVG